MSFYVGLPTDKPAYQRARRAISIPQLLTARQNQREGPSKILGNLPHHLGRIPTWIQSGYLN